MKLSVNKTWMTLICILALSPIAAVSAQQREDAFFRNTERQQDGAEATVLVSGDALAEKIAAAKAARAAAVKAAAAEAAAARGRVNSKRSSVTKLASIRSNDVAAYATKIRNAIMLPLGDISQYRGKTCTARINMNREGLIKSIKTEGGDEKLCRAIVAVMKNTQLPAPDSEYLYERFNSAALDFKP